MLAIDPYSILIVLALLVVVSYVFNIISNKLKFPSVLLLLGTGVGLRYLGDSVGYSFIQATTLLQFFGIVGLILIVLEGVLDLKITKDKASLIGQSFLSAVVIFFTTAGVISLIFILLLDIPIRNAIIYAIPLGIISSAIAIPSVIDFTEEKKEFIIYESTFSDIIGILLFNFIVATAVVDWAAVGGFFSDIILSIIVSIVVSLILTYFIQSINAQVKFFLVFSLLIILFSVGKLLHLPSLILIMVFGLIINNTQLLRRIPFGQVAWQKAGLFSADLKLITAETAFLVRTFFFLIFGYTLNLALIVDEGVATIGLLIVASILIIRYIFLRFILKTNVISELFIAPRGLVTIILFYSIPLHLRLDAFSEGIVYFVIIASSLLMILGLLTSKNPIEEYREDSMYSPRQ